MADKIGTPNRLLDAAEAELIEGGGHMEMASVAKRAGVSVGLAYHHFGSKTGLLAAVVDRFYEPLRDIALGTAIPPETPWAERERARTATMIAYFYSRPLAPLVAGRLARQPEVLDLEKSHMDALLAEGARNIAQGQRLGVVDPRLKPETTVAMLMGGLRLSIDSALLSKDRPSEDALLADTWHFIASALGLGHVQSTNLGGENANQIRGLR